MSLNQYSDLSSCFRGLSDSAAVTVAQLCRRNRKSVLGNSIEEPRKEEPDDNKQFVFPVLMLQSCFREGLILSKAPA